MATFIPGEDPNANKHTPPPSITNVRPRAGRDRSARGMISPPIPMMDVYVCVCLKKERKNRFLAARMHFLKNLYLDE